MDDKKSPAWVNRAHALLTHVPHLTHGELWEDWFLRCYAFGSGAALLDLQTLEELIESPRAVDVWKAAENFGTPTPWFVFRMAGIVRKSRDEFAALAITQKVRKRAAVKLQRLANQIADELSNPVVASCFGRARSAVIRQAEKPRDSRARSVSPDPEVFRAFAAVAAEMARQPKEIGQPNNDNAHRLYFMQTASNEFYKIQKTPMRKLVFALTSVYFDMGNLVVNDLSKLAPVNKQARK